MSNLVYANLKLSRDHSSLFVGGERRVIEFELELLFVFCRLASILSGVCHSSLVFLFTARAGLLRILLPQTDRSALLNWFQVLPSDTRLLFFVKSWWWGDYSGGD